MIKGYREFKDLLDKGNVIISNKRFEQTLKNFDFHQIQKKEILDEEMIQKINKSKVIIIDAYISMGNVYIIICYERELVITDHSNQSLFNTIFSRNNGDKVYFVPKVLPKCHMYSNFMEEISNFKEHFQINSKSDKVALKFWKIILPCISAFLIKKGYIDNSKDRLHEYDENIKSNEIKIYKKNEFVYLRVISSTNLSTVYLCYHIESEKILAIKKLHDSTDKSESREIKNYKTIKYPFIPKFFGTIPNDDGNSLVIDFINGNTLTKLHKNNLSFEQKLKNIFELLYTFQYLHQIHFIYRDLKPNNIILDENKHFVLIDFDRMISENDQSSTTMDFYTPYIDQNIIEGLITIQNDIYSIGKILYDIFNKKEIHDYPIINKFYKQCLLKNPCERPSIKELIDGFEECFSLIKINSISMNINKYITSVLLPHLILLAVNHNNSYAQLNLGYLYFSGTFVKQNIEKSIQFFTLAANQNDTKALNHLGHFYLDGKYIKQDTMKAVRYFTLAANQHDINSEYDLGALYSKNTYIKKDMNKAIHYLTQAAKKNHTYAQFNLGLIYYVGVDASCDINKSIYYLSLAANKQHTDAQCLLGIIYSDDEFGLFDRNKSVFYFTLAANQNHAEAQNRLGVIYCNFEYAQFDIIKSIHYFNLAANQNNLNALVNLGSIYYENKFVKRDIYKSIHYFTRAANQNHSEAQYCLGYIYYEDKYIARDISKSIYYFSLASIQNHSHAQFYLGRIYYIDSDIRRDVEKAIYYFTLAANQNHSDAQSILGFIYYEGKCVPRDISKSIYYLEHAAKQNHLESQFILGFIYYKGEYIPRDINKSIYYLEHVANKKHLEAQYLLGIIYYENKYIKRDMNKSIYYLTLAADQNHPDAQNTLGILYQNGVYIERDINKSMHYLQLAANQNYPISLYNLGILYCDSECINCNIEKGIRYLTDAANHNISDSQYILGVFYLKGLYLPKNIYKASQYFILAAKQNHIQSQFMLGLIYSIGENYQKDIEKSIHFYKEASSFNHSHAKNNLAMIFRNGIDTKPNIWYSIELLKESVKMNDPVSMYNLSHIYLYEKISENNSNNFKEIIDMLIKSSSLFESSNILLCLVLIKKNKNKITTIESIKNEIKSCTTNKSFKIDQLSSDIYFYIKRNNLDISLIFDETYEKYRRIDYMYDYYFNAYPTKELIKKQINDNDCLNLHKNITNDFFKGLGDIF